MVWDKILKSADRLDFQGYLGAKKCGGLFLIFLILLFHTYFIIRNLSVNLDMIFSVVLTVFWPSLDFRTCNLAFSAL